MSVSEIHIGKTIHKLIQGDCLLVMDELCTKGVKTDLIITDPPYNVGIDYGVYRDKPSENEAYFLWCEKWLRKCIDLLSNNGSMYLFNYPENNARLLPFLQKNLIFKRWITWHYPINIGHSPKNYTLSQRSILFCVKSENYKFNKNAIAVPYRNPTDKRIRKLKESGSKGRVPYDVFQYNIVKNVSREKTKHPCQIPIKLLEVFIKASSDKGDTVFDPFSGSFSTCIASAKLGRNSIGIEINNEFVEIGKKQLAVISPIESYV